METWDLIVHPLPFASDSPMKTEFILILNY